MGKSDKIAIAIVIIIILGLIGMGMDSGDSSSSSSGGKSKCAICGKTAVTTFQGSPYCRSHFEDALEWYEKKKQDD